MVKRAFSQRVLSSSSRGVVWTVLVSTLFTPFICLALFLARIAPRPRVFVDAYVPVIPDGAYVTSISALAAIVYYRHTTKCSPWVYVFTLMSVASAFYLDSHWEYKSFWMFMVLVRMSVFPHAWISGHDAHPSPFFWGLEDDICSWLLSLSLGVGFYVCLDSPPPLLLMCILGGGTVSRLARLCVLRRRQREYAPILLRRIRNLHRHNQVTDYWHTEEKRVKDECHKGERKVIDEWYKDACLPPEKELNNSVYNAMTHLPSDLVTMIVEYAVYNPVPWDVDTFDWRMVLVPENLVIVPNVWYEHGRSVEDSEMYLCIRGTGGIRPTFRATLQCRSWVLSCTTLTNTYVHFNMKCLNLLACGDLTHHLTLPSEYTILCINTNPRHDSITTLTFQLDGFYPTRDTPRFHELRPLPLSS